MPRIRIRLAAWRDITETAEFLEGQSGVGVADRFLSSFMGELETLSKMPRVGPLCGFQKREMRDIRRWPLTGFERWLIYYKPLKSGIDVARVLHGARNLDWIFE